MTVNWFQMQQAQLASLPAHYLALSESAKLYEPGECYAEFARNLPKNLPKERLLSDPDSARYSEHVENRPPFQLQALCYNHVRSAQELHCFTSKIEIVAIEHKCRSMLHLL